MTQNTALGSASPAQLPAWQQLSALAAAPQPHLRELLAAPDRRAAMQAHAAHTGVSVDFSRQALTAEVWAVLLDLARQAQVEQQRQSMFGGDAINTSEQCAALHVALRGASDAAASSAAPAWGWEIDQQVQTERARMSQFVTLVRSGQVQGSTGLPITDVVHMGMGGSDLGPRMATEALAAWCKGGHRAHEATCVRVHFVSNPDAWALHSVLRELNPERTLFVVASKTFTTPETLLNADSARRWLQEAGISASAQTHHFVALTASPTKAQAAGYRTDRIFVFWDWVGGRYSVWSAVGLSLALAIGARAFEDFLAGARAMDAHFCDTPLAHNLPVILALCGIWNRNFLRCPTQLLCTYPHRLRSFTPFVQQMEMESNGKCTHKNGQPCEIDTGAIVWGGSGIEGQHAYFQLLHQGQHRAPIEFIGVQREDAPLPLGSEHHRMLHINLQAQALALAIGREPDTTVQSLLAQGYSHAAAHACAAQHSFAGNTPSSLIWLAELTPQSLGALIALYEHKVFTQAAIWGINAYDQWGVALGKQIAAKIETD